MFKNVFKILKLHRLGCNYCSIAHKKRLPLTTLTRKLFSSTCRRSQQFISLENDYMHHIISKNFVPFATVNLEVKKVTNVEEFDELLSRNYRINSGRSASEVVNSFIAVKDFCNLNQISISDSRFDNLVDGLMDHCEKLTDIEILNLLVCLNDLPGCKYQDHNFHDVWSCLDDISKERIAGRSLDYLFQVADLWYQLGLAKLGDFIWCFLDYGAKKAKKLSKDELVKLFFFTNACRKKTVPFEFELALEKYIERLSPDELGIVALGYFKSMSKIKTRSIHLAMIEAVRKNPSTINQITLTSILKTLRYSKIGVLIVELNQMLDALSNEFERLSPQSCLHVAIIGSSMNHYHKNSMEKSTQILVHLMDDVSKVRLKDIERILSATTIVNFHPKCTPDLFETVFNEIHKDQRIAEMAKYPRILPSILNYLSIVNKYSYELMDRVLNSDFLNEVYGTGVGGVPRDIFLLDACIDIECADYRGNRLSPKTKYRLVKWMTDYIPSIDQYRKLTAYDKLFLEVLDYIKFVVGGPDVVRVDYVVPHFSRADLILCKDNLSQKFIEPPGFGGYFFGDSKFASREPNLTWYAVIVVGWNNTIRNTSIPVGMLAMKERHLRKLGYIPKMVIWNEFIPLSKEGKVKYIESILKQ